MAAMKRLESFVGQDLYWKRGGFWGSEYHLMRGSEVLASLLMRTSGKSSSAKTGDGLYTIQRQGGFSPSYHMYGGENRDEIAFYLPRQERLQCANGRAYNWRRPGFAREHAWVDDFAQVHMRFFLSSGKVHVVTEQTGSEHMLLAILGYYLESYERTYTINTTAADT